MIPVPTVAAPPTWDAKGRERGERWLTAHPVAKRDPKRSFRPRNYWSKFASELGEGFAWRCGYSAMYVPNGTVDHFVPWEDVEGTADEKLAYDWMNFRYSDGWFNSSRKCTPVPDPYTVGAGWFEITLPDLQLRATVAVPAGEAARAANLLRWMKDDPRVMRARRRYFALYRSGDMSLAALDGFAPLIAAAVRGDPTYLRVVDGGDAP